MIFRYRNVYRITKRGNDYGQMWPSIAAARVVRKAGQTKCGIEQVVVHKGGQVVVVFLHPPGKCQWDWT